MIDKFSLQRFRNAIDARIAEEQARQQTSAHATSQSSKPTVSRSPSSRPGASPSPRRSISERGAGTSSQRDSSLKGDRSNELLSARKEPDPAEFDPKFVIGEEDDGLSTGVGTPISQSQGPSETGDEKSEEEQSMQKAGQDRLGALKDRKIIGNERDEKKGDEDKEGGKDNKDGKDAIERETEKLEEITPEMKVRLRRLDKLEPKYQGLMAYSASYSFRLALTHL